jgi:hypothetical protein
VYNAAYGVQPERFRLYAFSLVDGQRSHTIGVRWAPTEKGAKAMLASLARTIRASPVSPSVVFPTIGC